MKSISQKNLQNYSKMFLVFTFIIFQQTQKLFPDKKVTDLFKPEEPSSVANAIMQVNEF